MPCSNFDIPHRFAVTETFPPENKQMEKNTPTQLPPDQSTPRMELNPFSLELGAGKVSSPVFSLGVHDPEMQNLCPGAWLQAAAGLIKTYGLKDSN